jgi:hypothetical protein
MPHSYVAKPAIVEASPDYPTGWNPIWPGPPGPPYPPGYSPSSPTAFDSEDEDEEVPPRYRVRATLVIDSADDILGLDTEFELAMHPKGANPPPFTTRAPWQLDANFAVAGNYSGDTFESEKMGAGFSVGGVAGSSSYVDHDNIVTDQSYLVYMYLRNQSGGYQLTFTLDLFRTPWVELPGGGHELGDESQVGQLQKVFGGLGSSGHGNFFPGWMHIGRSKSGLVVNEQWGVIENLLTEQYLV